MGGNLPVWWGTVSAAPSSSAAQSLGRVVSFGAKRGPGAPRKYTMWWPYGVIIEHS